MRRAGSAARRRRAWSATGRATTPTARGSLHRPGTRRGGAASWSPRAPRIRVLGTRHSFNAIADSDELMLARRACPAEVARRPRARHRVACSGGDHLRRAGGRAGARTGWRSPTSPRCRTSPSRARSRPPPTARATATATSPPPSRALELVTSDGELRHRPPRRRRTSRATSSRSARSARSCALELDVEPAYEVRQHVFEGLAWDALLEHLDEVFASAYAVSVVHALGRGGRPGVAQARDDGRPAAPSCSAPAPATRATATRSSATTRVHATPQLGAPARGRSGCRTSAWSSRPATARSSSPSTTSPRRHAAAAIEALRAAAPAIRGPLLVCELRTVAADELWLSPQHGEDTLGIHFTWAREPEARRARGGGRRGRARPVRAAPALGQGLPHRPRRARRALPAPGRLRRARRAARPARRVPQRLAGGALCSSSARAGGRSRPAGSSGRRGRPPRSASARTAAPGTASPPTARTPAAAARARVEKPNSSAAVSAPPGRQRPKISAASAMKPLPTVMFCENECTKPIDRYAPPAPASTPDVIDREVARAARPTGRRSRPPAGSRPPSAAAAPAACGRPRPT